MNCWLVLFARLGIGGVTAIDTRVAGVTVRVVDPDKDALTDWWVDGRSQFLASVAIHSTTLRTCGD